ncbi:MAG: two-component regulator propeller domain-containing protein [bacterium]|nr:two-component regulator propeller domain-containing protein [bacterium]
MADSRFRGLLCITVFALLFCNRLNSQFNNFKKWSIKDGLAQSDVYDILQDSRNYLWIATGGGVSVFDGFKFKNFTKRDGLAGNTVRCLFEDAEGRMWCGTNEGLCYNDGISFHTMKDAEIKGSTVLCFAEDSEHNLFVGTDDGGVNILHLLGDSLKVQNLNEQNGLSSNSVFDIKIDKSGQIWMATYGGGLNILKKFNGTYECKVVKGTDIFPSDNLVCVELNEKEVWLGSYDAGAFCLSKEKILRGEFQKAVVFDEGGGLNSNSVWDILIAKDKRIWIGSLEKGINRLEKASDHYNNTSFTDKNGLSDNQILRVFEDKDGNLWIGTNGNGLCMLRGDYFSHYSVSDGLLSDKIQSIQQDQNGSYWLACSGAGLTEMKIEHDAPALKNYVDKTGLTDFISSIAIGRASNNNIWFGTDDHGLAKFDGSKFYNFTEKDGLVNNRVYTVFVDSNGIVWSGTADGISRFDGIRFLNISTDKMKMKNEGVKTIVEGIQHTIWFGTSGGMARYKGEGDLRTFDEVEGLKAKDVNALAPCKNGDVYIGTNTGGLYKYNHFKNDTNAIEFVCGDSLLLSNSIRSLVFYDEHTLMAGTLNGFDKIYLSKIGEVTKVKHYRLSDGFKGLECNDNSILLDREKNVWFGTVNGITKFSPRFEKERAKSPDVFITDLQLAFKEVNWKTRGLQKQKWFNLPTSLSLAFDENHLTFKFHANNAGNQESVSYKIKLEGSDNNWSPPRKSNEVTFSGLSPGSYTFMVMAENESELWSKPATFAFSISPPWYKTKTFYGSSFLLILLLLYTYIKWREKKLVKEKIILEHTVKERTQEVEVQKEHLAEKNKEITDSINYAKGIQAAMLPPMADIYNAWKDIFVFFQPKDIVSGDFYWFKKINEDEFLIACADCTGHGVPGGFMSMVCSGELYDAAKETTEPAKILSKTNNAVKLALRQQTDVEGKNRDGMEICLLKVNTATGDVSYSGANRLLWIVDGETRELKEQKPTKASIASFTEFDFEYQQVELKLKKGDLLYTTSDGYPDQFGGAEGKKYMSKNLKNLIVQNCHLPLHDQLHFFRNDINTWMKDCEQVDDLLVIGIRL